MTGAGCMTGAGGWGRAAGICGEGTGPR
jgi:hypothetical protein